MYLGLNNEVSALYTVTVRVTHTSLLWQNTWGNQLTGENVYFGSLFQRFLLIVHWLYCSSLKQGRMLLWQVSLREETTLVMMMKKSGRTGIRQSFHKAVPWGPPTRPCLRVVSVFPFKLWIYQWIHLSNKLVISWFKKKKNPLSIAPPSGDH